VLIREFYAPRDADSSSTLDVENAEPVNMSRPDPAGGEARTQSRESSPNRIDSTNESVELTAEPLTAEAIHPAVSLTDLNIGNPDLVGGSHTGQADGVRNQLAGDPDNRPVLGSEPPSIVEANPVAALPAGVGSHPNEDGTSGTVDLGNQLVEHGSEPLTSRQVHFVAPPPPPPSTNPGYNPLLDKPRPDTMTEYLRFVRLSNFTFNGLTPVCTVTTTSYL
jgi:hypothetical protein